MVYLDNAATTYPKPQLVANTVAMAMRKFGGATGDTTGFCLQICELVLLVGACAGGIIL